MKKSNYGHRVQVLGRIDIRYYVIEFEGRRYILDYFNPLCIRSYLGTYDFRYQLRYPVYELSNEEANLTIKPVSSVWDYIRNSINILSVIILLLVLFFPKFFVRQKYIQEHWGMILCILFLTIISIVSLLVSYRQKDLMFAKRNFSQLISTNKLDLYDKLGVNPIWQVMLTILLLVLCCSIGILSSNIVLLSLFTFLGTFSILFTYPISIQQFLAAHKFIIQQKGE